MVAIELETDGTVTDYTMDSFFCLGMTVLHIAVSSLIFFSALLALFGKDWTHIRY